MKAVDNDLNDLKTAMAPDPEIRHECKEYFLGGVTILEFNLFDKKN